LEQASLPQHGGARQRAGARAPGAGPARRDRDSLIILPWNDTALLREVLEREGHDIAAVITERSCATPAAFLPEPG